MNRSKSKKNKKQQTATNAAAANESTVTRTMSAATPPTSKTTPAQVRKSNSVKDNFKTPAEPKKLERSNSFVMSKLTGLYQKMRGSQDNLNKTQEAKRTLPPFLTTRSHTLSEISTPRKNFRRSIREPKLAELREEHDTTEPVISEEPTSPTPPTVILRPKPNQNEESDDESPSGTIFGRLKRTFSITSEKRKSLNSKWNVSLQSLQNIDTMVSYEDLRFIDYDKFNTYARQIEQRMSLPPSHKSISPPKIEQLPQTESPPPSPLKISITPPKIIEPPKVLPVIPTTHLRRREKKKRVVSQFDATYEKNFDAGKNLYRQSFDRRTLEHFKDINRDSFRMSNSHDITDSLLLENYFGETSVDQVDTVGATKDVKDVSKSKSLTHLDQLNPDVEIQNEQRTEVSSSEYFTVYFNLNNDSNDDKELIIPSTKGVTLVNALSSALSMRNLTFSQITISDNNFPSSAELGTGSYCGVVDENTDVGYLAGKMLIVTEKEGNIMIKRSHSLLKKAASVGTSKTPKLFSSVSTEDAIENLESSKLSLSKQPKQRWSSFLGIKNPQQNQLCELLNSYDKSSVPSLKTPQLSQTPEYSEAVTYLDTVLSSTWINFVDRSGMTDQETKIQSAIWELVATEADYIRALQTVTNLFLACLESVQAENLLIDVDQNKLFSNIRDICNVNIQFWSLYLYPMVKYSEKTSQPMCVEYLKNGFLSFAAHFAPYTKYCAEQSTCQNTCKELNSSNLLFTAYLAWCESRSECKRLRLADILVRPMQRLTKYSLLLIAIRKHLSYDETGCELMDEMIHSVEDFVCSVNSHLTTRQENERLKGIMARIEVYDVVDSINEHLDKMVKPYNKMFDLCEPMKGCTIAQSRHLFLEGDLKFKDNSSKVDVHCFLLTDILLICKPISKRGPGALKVIRQPFMTDKLVIQLKDNVIYCVYLNDFNTAVTAFSLQSSEAKNWHDSFIKVKHIYTRLKQGLHPDDYSFKSFGGNDGISIRKSPGNSSFGSKVPSSNNSVSGSVELNESKNVSVDHDKTNSFSSDEGSNIDISTTKQRSPQSSSRKYKPVSSNSLIVQPSNSLGQSLPNLNLNIGQNSINHSLLVPGTSNKTSSHSNHLLSPSHRGISYPPPSPPRATLQRTRAIHSVKNPPLMKTKNVSSQSSFSWTQSQQETTSFARPQLSEPNIHHHSTESEV